MMEAEMITLSWIHLGEIQQLWLAFEFKHMWVGAQKAAWYWTLKTDVGFIMTSYLNEIYYIFPS